MKVIEWNVHGINTNRCPTYVAHEIKRQKADIVILLEYVENINYDGPFECKLKEYGYKLFRQPKKIKGNAVLIAIKLTSEMNIDCRKRVYYIENSSINFMSAFIEYNGQPITIVGCRITAGSSPKERYSQIIEIKNYINGLPEEDKKSIIVTGDFNNYQILGDENDYENISQYIGKDSEDYNLQLIKKEFKQLGFYVCNSTPHGNVYTSYSTIYKNYPYKYDHIFVKGLNLSHTKYDWDYKEINYVNDGGRDPDHAILKANVEV